MPEKTDDLPPVAKRLLELQGGRTQAEFARTLGMTPQQYNRYVRGKRPPDRKVAARIAERCGVIGMTAARLLYGPDGSPPPGTSPASPAPTRAAGEEHNEVAIAMEVYQWGAKLALLRIHDRESYDLILQRIRLDLQHAGLDHVSADHLELKGKAQKAVIAVMRSAIRRERRRVAQQMGDTAQ